MEYHKNLILIFFKGVILLHFGENLYLLLTFLRFLKLSGSCHLEK